ncbi:MAG: LPP20 family lipoprotein [Nitrospiraceae bacterium]
MGNWRGTPPLALFLTGIMFAALPGCATLGSGGSPDWVSGASADYPADQYLLGVGQADSRSVAEERAYAAVAKIFKAEVSAQSKDWESYRLLEDGGESRTRRQITLDKITRVSTDKVLENVRIIDTWKNPQAGQYYALAGMERAQAGAAMAERVNELDRVVDREWNQARQAQDQLEKIQGMKRAVNALLLREAYNADLRVIRTSGQGIRASYRVQELVGELDQYMKNHLAVEVDITGDQADAVQHAIVEGLVREGLPVTTQQVAADGQLPSDEQQPYMVLQVQGSVKLWPVVIPDPRFQYVRWCSDFVIVEPASQRVIGAVSRGGREGHLSRQEAMARALRVIQQQVASELAETLAAYIFGEIDQPSTIPPAACPTGALDGERSAQGQALHPLL